jgi:hypothetical protein
MRTPDPVQPVPDDHAGVNFRDLDIEPLTRDSVSGKIMVQIAHPLRSGLAYH